MLTGRQIPGPRGVGNAAIKSVKQLVPLNLVLAWYACRTKQRGASLITCIVRHLDKPKLLEGKKFFMAPTMAIAEGSTKTTTCKATCPEFVTVGE
jgi:hypothetical protein